ncbi:outer membrane beta-barrel protein [Ascidiimonas aurantiaca]|uniref:outer membrane beta-barrel protein n=1 Tax=Ascidiimonas aurantiaca TaxID=1685432 RepID=UPI0030EB44D3
MKKVIVCILMLGSAVTFAQKDSGFGLKGGLNYNSNGEYFRDAGAIAEDPTANVGFHLGVWGKVDLGTLYLRPELVYTKTKSDYDGDKFDMSKIDVPLLVGLDVIGPLSVFAGPSIQYILDTDLDGITLNDVENDLTVGFNIGAGLNIGNIGIDLRYERGFSDNEAEFVGLSGSGRIDTRPEQLILSLSVKL